MGSAIQMHNVTKRFEKPCRPRAESLSLLNPGRYSGAEFTRGIVAALDQVSLQIQEGEYIGLWGANGSGKSTLIRLLAALLRPDEGEIQVFGCDPVRQPQQAQRWTNRVATDSSFFKSRSALENLRQDHRIYSRMNLALHWTAEELLVRLGFDEAALHVPMGNLSAGEVQLVAVARALLCRPRLLLLDEPTRGLDARARRAVRDLVDELRRGQLTTVVWAARDLDEVRGIFDRTVHIQMGRINSCLDVEGQPIHTAYDHALELDRCLEWR